MPRLPVLLTSTAAVLALAATGCGSSSSPATGGSAAGGGLRPPAKEVTPPGDIPDNQVFVAYAPPGAGFSVKVPEGWSRTTRAGTTTFTDKLNSVAMELAPAERTATVATVRRAVLPQLARTVRGYTAGGVSTVMRGGLRAVRVTYRATSAADPVTGRTHRVAAERYEFAKGGRVAAITLTGAVGADNVDPWKLVSGSFRWTR